MDLNEQLQNIRDGLGSLIPEIFLVLLFSTVLIFDLFRIGRTDTVKTNHYLLAIAAVGASVSLALAVRQWYTEPTFLFNSFLHLDRHAVFFKVLIVVAWLFTLFHIRILKYDFPPEFHALLISVVLGLQLLVMSTHFLAIYLSVELVSLSSYLLVALSPYKKAAEGGLKYLLFGAASSAIMLYGISLIYGITGTLHITNQEMLSGLLNNSQLIIVTSVLLMLGGLLFKLSLVPFHVWTPDVYEAAPTPLVSFLSVAPKAGVILVLMRLVYVMPPPYFQLLGGIALLSMTYGNIAALWQTNARRLLAYSTIAQAGYLVVGVVAFSKFGFEAAVFYTAAYLILNLSAFFLIDVLKPKNETELVDYRGLGIKNIWVSVSLTMVMVALAGLPPTVGFTSKMLIFSALWDGYQHEQPIWMLWLLIGGILNAAIALGYYLRLPYLLFFKSGSDSKDSSGHPVSGHSTVNIAAAILLFTILLLFFKPDFLLNLIAGF